eukprot:NODE_166_length_14584_cov_1.124750.p12 type:complete len:108 gc:universal NODE_166_length_14584_cov_1.124750:12532-12209(-)
MLSSCHIHNLTFRWHHWRGRQILQFSRQLHFWQLHYIFNIVCKSILIFSCFQFGLEGMCHCLLLGSFFKNCFNRHFWVFQSKTNCPEFFGKFGATFVTPRFSSWKSY